MEHLKEAPTLEQTLDVTNKHYSMLERLAKDKHSSLLQTFVNNGRKMFSNIGARAQCYKTTFVRNLLIFVISQSACP